MVAALLEQVGDLFLSISCTTRSPRPGELEHSSYRFVTEEEFDDMVAAGEFLEWAQVFGNRYGTPAGPIERARDAGSDAILEIDVQGARAVEERVSDAVLVFLVPPTQEELARRLMSRGTEDENELARRLTAAADEMANSGWFHHVVINDDLESATDEVAGIILEYRRSDAPDS